MHPPLHKHFGKAPAGVPPSGGLGWLEFRLQAVWRKAPRLSSCFTPDRLKAELQRCKRLACRLPPRHAHARARIAPANNRTRRHRPRVDTCYC